MKFLSRDELGAFAENSQGTSKLFKHLLERLQR